MEEEEAGAVWSIWRAEKEESAGEEVGEGSWRVLRAGRLWPEEVSLSIPVGG